MRMGTVPLQIFQSTHPRRVRPGDAQPRDVRQDFNPRTHEGCDWLKHHYSQIPYQFQSTHPRRVRLNKQAEYNARMNISIHAPTKGATLYLIKSIVSPRGISIHAPTKGATWGGPVYAATTWISIHAPTKGATTWTPSNRPA